MRRLAVIAAMAAVAIVMMTPPSVSGVPADGPEVIGISKLDSSGLKIAIDSASVIAYPDVTWYVYLPAPEHVTGTDPLGSIVDADLGAGLHIYTREYAAGKPAVITWNIAGDLSTFSLVISSSASAVYDHLQVGKVEIDAGALGKLELETAAGCIALVLVPSVFLVPFWKKRKDRGWSDAFE